MAVALDVVAYNESISELSNSTTTYTDLVSVTFTPSQTEELIILACVSMRMDPDSAYARVQLEIDSEISWDQASDPLSTSQRYSWGVMRVKSLDNTPHTVKLTFSSSSGGVTCYAQYANLIVLRNSASARSVLPTEDEVIQFYEI